MSYLLQPLLKIRAMREDRAAGELTVARRAVSVAEEAVEERKKDLEEFERTKEERRDRIYDAIIGKSITFDQLSLAQEGVARIDQEGVLKLDNVRQAERELQEKENAAEAARNVFVTATKNRMKIDEHKAVWVQEEAKAEESRAEGELEDFTGRKQDLDG
ncbi:MAG: YscO family type III secretion system apparatus protein [Kiritimatiellae bacterium]|nr:YscO family type III secretion system apparatus protein [Kiritimatiellia bacterium]